MALPVLPSFFHSHRSLCTSLKPPPAPCTLPLPLLPSLRDVALFLSLSHVHTYTRVHIYTYIRRGVQVRVQVCTTRDSSTSSTIYRVRRSTPPRFNIQTICNNFAATITPFLLPVPLSLYLPPDFAALLLSLSLFLSLSRLPHILFLKPPSSASPSLSFIPSPLIPPSPNSPVSSPFLSCPTVFLPPHEETWHVRTHPHRDLARLLHGVVHALYLHLPPCDRNHSKSPCGH